MIIRGGWKRKDSLSRIFSPVDVGVDINVGDVSIQD